MSDWLNKCHFGDVRDVLRSMIADGVKVQTIVTSPPYFGLRDYGHAGQIGLETSPDEYVASMVDVFSLCRDVLADDGTLWLNLGDSYANDGKWGGHTGGKHAKALHASPIGRNKRYTGLKPKDLIGIPWMTAFALRTEGWYLRQGIIWNKPNTMPESVKDRCTKSHEDIFLMSKSQTYYFNSAAIQEPAAASSAARWAQNIEAQAGSDRVPGKTNGAMKAVGGPRRKQDSTNESAVPGAGAHGGIHREGTEREPETRNKRSVWTVPTKSYKGAHFATFPPDLITPCILAGAPAGGVVLDPFFGSGTTGQVSQALGRRFIGIELNTDYKALQDERLQQPSLDLEQAA